MLRFSRYLQSPKSYKTFSPLRLPLMSVLHKSRRATNFLLKFFNHNNASSTRLNYRIKFAPRLRLHPPTLRPPRALPATRLFSSFPDSAPDPEPNPTEEAARICKVINELFASDRNMEAVLDSININLSSNLVISVLNQLQHAHKPAFRFFKWVESKPGFQPDPSTYLTMLTILSKRKQFESMVEFLNQMAQKEMANIDAFKVCIQAFAKAREMKKAVGILKMMKRFNPEAGINGFNCLINSLGNTKLAKEANELFDKMKDEFEPNLISYSMILSAHCLVKNLVDAGRVWNEMIDTGLKPDTACYNIMLEGFIRAQKRDEAMKLFDVMKAKGPFPNARTYTIIIHDLCKAQKMERAVKCFEEMVNSGCAPDVSTYTCLMLGFGNSKQMDKVSGLLKEMKEKGVPPDGRTYNALIKLMTNRNMAEDAVRIYKKMIKKGFEPTIHTYNMMMKCHFKKDYEMGCEVWEEMGRKGICPDVNSYTVYIGGHVRHGRAELACKYMEEMMNKGMRAPEIDYNKFCADYCKMGRYNVLYELGQKMKSLGMFNAYDVLNDWAERMKGGGRRRVVNQTGDRLF